LFIKGRQIKIDFELEPIRQIHLFEFKDFVLERVQLTTDLYSDYKEMIDFLQSADTYEKVIEVFY
jgi:hypothetical protein